MAWRESHVWNVGHIPGADNQAATVGILFYLLFDFCNLVYHAPFSVGPGAPLPAIDRTEFAVFVGPFIPNPHAVFLKISDVGVAFEKPKEFVYDRLQMELFCCEQGKTVGKVISHLTAEDAQSSGSGSVGFESSVVEDVLQEVEVLLHARVVEGLF